MRYITLGASSAETEFLEVIQRAEGNRMYEASELLSSLSEIETRGFAIARKQWVDADGNESVKVYWGKPEAEETSIWAAIEVGADGKSITLIKITDRYTGGNREWHDLLADALDRRTRGTIK